MSAGGQPQQRRSPVGVGWIVIYSAVFLRCLADLAQAKSMRRQNRAVAGAQGEVRTVRLLDQPIGDVEAVTVAFPEEIGISDHEIDLLLHWCGDLLAPSDLKRG